MNDKFRGCLLGLAIGDAIGTTAEFKDRGSFVPVTDMVGGGVFRLEPGQWTDDTSMALCLAESLIKCNEFNAHDQMVRYGKWWQEGYLSSNGRCFDIGGTTRSALAAFMVNKNPYSGTTHAFSAGNGCIMRLAPIPMYYSHCLADAAYYGGESSRTTHGAPECVDASRLYAVILAKALHGARLSDAVSVGDYAEYGITEQKVIDIANLSYHDKSIDDIKGSGYVIESLEAALWCVTNSSTFEDAVLTAVNLGDDADTTAAIAGQLAGAAYGINGIPEHWVETVSMRSTIIEMADALFVLSQEEE